ncbi:MAG: C40 family peptidase [Treponema sp.]|jgi:cell wall-associated NlpC family hydrolase|nr:C40 family peptidase [Treponema sp.]
MIPSWVEGYIGIPFVSGGRDRAGCDCYGLVRLVLSEQFGYTLPLLNTGYVNACRTEETAPLFKEHLPLLAGCKISRAEPGAVAVIRFSGRASHVGIFVDDRSILHSIAGIGAFCTAVNHASVRGALEGIYRVSDRYRPNTPL